MIYHATCREYHRTVAEARACSGPVGYGGEPAAPFVQRQGHTLDRRPYAERVSPARSASSAARDVPATPPQVRYIRGLQEERVVPVAGRTPEEGELLERAFDIVAWRSEDFDPEHDKYVSKREASDVIQLLKSFPRKEVAVPASDGTPAVVVPEGKYALQAEDGAITFWVIDRPTEGHWAGYCFTKMLLGAPGSWNKVRIPRDRERVVHAEIGKDVFAATVLFGRKSKHCGRCSAPLSNVRSRAAGYGETCANNMGWHYPTESEARATLSELGEEMEPEQLALSE